MRKTAESKIEENVIGAKALGSVGFYNTLSFWQKLFLTLFMLSIIALFIFGFKALELSNQTKAEHFEWLWQKDLENLEKAKILPKPWAEIAEIMPIPSGPRSQKLLEQISIPIKTNAQGTHRLEILLIDWEEGELNGFIIQYDLMEKANNNLIWELGRTFLLRGSLKDLEQLAKPETTKAD